MLKKLFSDTAIYGLAPQIPKIVSIFILPILTKHLTAFDFGVYGIITSLVTGISVFATLGLNVVLSNSFFKESRYIWTWRQIYGILIIWNIPYGILLGMLIYLFIPNEALPNATWIIISNVLPIVFFGPTATLGGLYYQLQRKPLQIAVRSTILGILTIVLNVYLIVYKGMGYMGWFISSAISQMLGQLSFWIPLNFIHKITPIFRFNKLFLSRNLKIALPTVPHSYGAYLLNTSDRLVMKIVGISTLQIGMYNAAYTVSNFIKVISNASGQAAMPLLLKAYKENKEHIARRVTFTLTIAFLVITFICSLWLKEIFYALINNAVLRETYPLGIIIVMSNCYRPMYVGANNRLFYFEKTRTLLKITLVAGVSNVLLNIILIPLLGYQAAAYTTYIGLMYIGYSGYFLKEFENNVTLNYYPIRWLVTTIFLTVLAYYMVELAAVHKFIISLTALGVGYISYTKLLIDGEE